MAYFAPRKSRLRLGQRDCIIITLEFWNSRPHRRRKAAPALARHHVTPVFHLRDKEIRRGFAKAAALASALTLLFPAISLHSAFARETTVNTPVSPGTSTVERAPPAAVPSVPSAPAAAVGNSASGSIPAADAAPVHQPAIATGELPQDLSAWGMFLHADQIVKAVMIGLALASLVTWAIWLVKSLELRSARSEVQKDLRVLANCSTLAEAHGQLLKGTSSVAQLMQGAADEIRASIKLRADGLKERIAWQLERMEVTASRKIARGTGVLATIGSTAPFVGLFGTVWGIMDSFISISHAHTTNLAVVAPGIAEALLATALGLVAAIPAVVIYNLLARLTARYRALLADASAQVITLVSRDLERAKEPVSQAAE
jgi:biopolymer transport protein ExbB